MRLFIAINFDEKTKDRIQKVQERMKRISRGNYTRRDNLHLTLAFFGEVPEDRVSDIINAMSGISVPQMQLTFSEIGCFRRDSEIWWIGLKKNENLIKVQSQLCDELLKSKFKLESRKFIPHITIARQTSIEDEKAVGFMSDEFTTTGSSIDLMVSERIGGKIKYRKLYSVT